VPEELENLKWALGWLGKKRRVMALAVLCSLSAIGLMTVGPFLFRIVIDDVLLGGQYNKLLPLLSLALASVLATQALRYTANMLCEVVSQHVVVTMRARLFERVLRQTAAFHRENTAGSLITLCTGDVEIVRHFICWVMPRSIECVAMMLTVLTLFMAVNPLYALCLFVLTPISGTLAYKLGRSIRPAHKKVRECRERLSTVVNENISGNRVIRAFAREAHEIERFERENQAFRDAQVNANRIWLRFQPYIEFMAQTLGAVNLIVGSVFVVLGRITLGQMSIFQNLAWALNDPMLSIGAIVNDAQRFAASADKLIALQYSHIAIRQPDAPHKADIAGKIELRHVTLTAGGAVLLHDINLVIEKGLTVGFMGPTGSGKSLLAGLLPRLYDPTSGQVLIDGVNVKDYDLRCLRGQIGMTMQDVFIFSDSVDSNIAYGDPEAPPENVRRAAELADAHEFVSRFPQGYNTVVGERGTGISGGQKQRLSLARAILPNPSVIILDDTTSAVDMETEKKIQDNLAGMETRATKLIIAQRVSSVKNADCIYIIDGGKVTEHGDHARLMANKGYYYDTYRLQHPGEAV
jgi:ATP-binding cassette subfamily B protein